MASLSDILKAREDAVVRASQFEPLSYVPRDYQYFDADEQFATTENEDGSITVNTQGGAFVRTFAMPSLDMNRKAVSALRNQGLDPDLEEYWGPERSAAYKAWANGHMSLKSMSMAIQWNDEYPMPDGTSMKANGFNYGGMGGFGVTTDREPNNDAMNKIYHDRGLPVFSIEDSTLATAAHEFEHGRQAQLRIKEERPTPGSLAYYGSDAEGQANWGAIKFLNYFHENRSIPGAFDYDPNQWRGSDDMRQRMAETATHLSDIRAINPEAEFDPQEMALMNWHNAQIAQRQDRNPVLSADMPIPTDPSASQAAPDPAIHASKQSAKDAGKASVNTWDLYKDQGLGIGDARATLLTNSNVTPDEIRGVLRGGNANKVTGYLAAKEVIKEKANVDPNSEWVNALLTRMQLEVLGEKGGGKDNRLNPYTKAGKIAAATDPKMKTQHEELIASQQTEAQKAEAAREKAAAKAQAEAASIQQMRDDLKQQSDLTGLARPKSLDDRAQWEERARRLARAQSRAEQSLGLTGQSMTARINDASKKGMEVNLNVGLQNSKTGQVMYTPELTTIADRMDAIAVKNKDKGAKKGTIKTVEIGDEKYQVYSFEQGGEERWIRRDDNTGLVSVGGPKNRNSWMSIMPTYNGKTNTITSVQDVLTRAYDRTAGTSRSVAGAVLRSGAEIMTNEDLSSPKAYKVAMSMRLQGGNIGDATNQLNERGVLGGNWAPTSGNTILHANDPTMWGDWINESGTFSLDKFKRLKLTAGSQSGLAEGPGVERPLETAPMYLGSGVVNGRYYMGEGAPSKYTRITEAVDEFAPDLAEGAARRRSTLVSTKDIDLTFKGEDAKRILEAQAAGKFGIDQYFTKPAYTPETVGEGQVRGGGMRDFNRLLGTNFKADMAWVSDIQQDTDGSVRIRGKQGYRDLNFKGETGKNYGVAAPDETLPQENGMAVDVWRELGDPVMKARTARAAFMAEFDTQQIGDYIQNTANLTDEERKALTSSYDTKTGRVAIEAAPLMQQVANEWYDNSRGRIVTRNNVNISDATYEALKEAAGDQGIIKGTFGGKEYTKLDINSIVKNDVGDMAGYTIPEMQTVRWQGETLSRVRVESTNEGSTINPDTLEMIAEHNPALYRALREQYKPNERALDIAQSYNANSNPDTLEKLQTGRGVHDFNAERFDEIRSEIAKKNPDIEPDIAAKQALAQYGKENKGSIRLDSGLILPSATTLSKEITGNASGELGYGFGHDAYSLLAGIGSATPEARKELEADFKESYDKMGNSRSIWNKAIGLDVPTPRKLMTPGIGLDENETVIKTAQAMKMLRRMEGTYTIDGETKKFGGITRADAMKLAEEGQLPTGLFLRQPMANPSGALVGAKVSLWEQKSEEFRKANKDPGAGILTSERIAQATQGDFDSDRALFTFVQGFKPTSESRLRYIARYGTGNEFGKQVERFEDIFGGKVLGRIKDEKKFTPEQLAVAGYNAEVKGRGSVGMAYNFSHRLLARFGTLTTEKAYGEELAQKMSESSSMLAEFSMQRGVDLSDKPDTALNEIVKIANTGIASDRFISWRDMEGNSVTGSKVGVNTTEDLARMLLKKSALIGSSLLDDPKVTKEQYMEQIAKPLAAQLSDRGELNAALKSKTYDDLIAKRAEMIHAYATGKDGAYAALEEELTQTGTLKELAYGKQDAGLGESGSALLNTLTTSMEARAVRKQFNPAGEVSGLSRDALESINAMNAAVARNSKNPGAIAGIGQDIGIHDAVAANFGTEFERNRRNDIELFNKLNNEMSGSGATPELVAQRKEVYDRLKEAKVITPEASLDPQFYPRASSQPNEKLDDLNRVYGHVATAFGGIGSTANMNQRIKAIQDALGYQWKDPNWDGKHSGLPEGENASVVGRNIHEALLPQLLGEQGVKAEPGQNYEVYGTKGSEKFMAKGTPDLILPYKEGGEDRSIIADVKSKTPTEWAKIISGEVNLGDQYGTQTAAYSDMMSKRTNKGNVEFTKLDGSGNVTTRFNDEYSVIIPTRMMDDNNNVVKDPGDIKKLQEQSGREFIQSIRDRIGRGEGTDADRQNLSMFERTGIAGHWVKNSEMEARAQAKNEFNINGMQMRSEDVISATISRLGGADAANSASPAQIASAIKDVVASGGVDTTAIPTGGAPSLSSPSPAGADIPGGGAGGMGGDGGGVNLGGPGVGSDGFSGGGRPSKSDWKPNALSTQDLSKARVLFDKYQEMMGDNGDTSAFREWVGSNAKTAQVALNDFNTLNRVMDVGERRSTLIRRGEITATTTDAEYRKQFDGQSQNIKQMLAQEGGFMQGVSNVLERRNLENGSRTAEPVGADQISKAATALEVFTTKLGKTSEAFDKTIPSVEKMGDMTDKQLRGVGNAIEMFDTFTKTYDKAIAAREAGIATPESEQYVQKYGGQIEKMKEEIGPRIEETRQSLARQQAENSLDFGYNKESRRGFLFDTSAEGTKLRNQAFEAGEYGGEGALGALGRAGAGFVGGVGRMAQGFFDPGTLWGLRALNSQFMNPVMQQAKEYAVSEGKMMSTLAQTGQGGFDDMMSGAYGEIARAENYRSNQRFETGKQAYAAWSPIVNFAIGGGDQIGGLATSLAGPSIGMGLVAQRLFANSKVFGANAGMAAGVVGGATALAGLVSYAASNRDNYQDIGSFNNDIEKYRQQQPDNVFGELGARIQALAANPAGGFGNLANAASQAFHTASQEDIKKWEFAPVFANGLNVINELPEGSSWSMADVYKSKVFLNDGTPSPQQIYKQRDQYVRNALQDEGIDPNVFTAETLDTRQRIVDEFNSVHADQIARANEYENGVSISDRYSKAEFRNAVFSDWVDKLVGDNGRMQGVSREQVTSAYGFLAQWRQPDKEGFISPPKDSQVKSFLNFETQGISSDQMTSLLRSRAAAQGLNAADSSVMDTLSNELIAQGDTSDFLKRDMDMSSWANQNLASYNPTMRQLADRGYTPMTEEAFTATYKDRPETAAFVSSQYASWAQGQAVRSAFSGSGMGFDWMVNEAISRNDLLGAQRIMNAPDVSPELTAQIKAIVNPSVDAKWDFKSIGTMDALQSITKPLIEKGLEQYNTAYQQYAAANIRASGGQFNMADWTDARAQQFAQFSAKGLDVTSLAQAALQAQGVNVNQTNMDQMLSGDFIARMINDPALAEIASAALPNIANINEQRRALGIDPISAFDRNAYGKYQKAGDTRRQMALDEYMGSFNTVNAFTGETGARTQDFMNRWQSAIDSKDVVAANYYANASKRFSAEESASLESLYGSDRADLYGEFARSEANGQVRGVAQRLMAYNALGSNTAEIASTGSAIRAGVARNIDVAQLGEQLATSTTAPKTFEAMSAAVQSFTEAIKVMTPQRMDMLNQAAPGIAQINQQRAFYGQQEMNWASMSDDQLRATAWSPGLQARMQLEQMRGQFIVENGIGAGENSPIANRFANIAARVDQGMLAPAEGIQAANNIQSIMNMGMRYVANGSMDFGDLQTTAANLGEGMNAVQIAQMQAVAGGDPYALNNAISSGMVSSISMGTIDSNSGLKIGTASLTPAQVQAFMADNVASGVGAARLLNDSRNGLSSFITTKQVAAPASAGAGFGSGAGGTQTVAEFTDPAMAGGVMGLQAEMIDVQAAAAGASYYYGEMGRQYSMASNMGGGKLDAQGFVVGGNLNQAAAIAKKFGVDFNVGNGMTEWMIDDRQTQIRREQQQYGTQQQQQNLDLQREKLEMENRQFNERFGLSQEKFQWQTTFQRQEMDIGRQHQITQQSWQREDMAFNRNQTNLNFGWQMEDMDRNIAFSRGRQRIDLERQQERAVISYSMQMGRQDTQEKRAEEQIKWADEEFNRKKKNFEEGVVFQLREMEMQKKHHEEQYEMSLRQLGLQQDAANKNKAWQEELMKLEDQKRLLDRQGWIVNQNIQHAAAAAQAGAAARTAELNRQINALTGSQGVHEARVSSLINTGRIFNDVASNMNNHLSVTNNQLSVASANLMTSTQSVIQSSQAISAWPANVRATDTAFGAMLAQVRAQLANINVNVKVNVSGGGQVTVGGKANGGWVDANPELAKGYAEGGYTGYGTNKYAIAGFVHTNEYVVPERGALVVRGDNQQIPYLQKMVDLLQELASNSRGPKVVNNNITNTSTQRYSAFTSLDQAYSRKM